MPQLTQDQLAAAAAHAGFSGPALVTAVAIAEAESGGNYPDPGDVNLQDSTWGPSIGPWQVRSLKAQLGTGGLRDALANADPQTDANAAFSISGQGSNFGPWTTFTDGAYRSHLSEAQSAVGDLQSHGATNPGAFAVPTFSALNGAGAPSTSATGTTTGLSLNPVTDIKNAVSSVLKGAAGPIVNFAEMAGFVMLGLGLIGAGAWKLAPSGAKDAAKGAVGSLGSIAWLAK